MSSVLCWVWGCAAPAPAPHGCDLSGSHLLVATTDFQVGALAAIDLQTGCVADRLASVGPDPLVRMLDASVVVASRGQGDTVWRFDPGVYDRPIAEFVPQVAGNVHDVVQIGEALWLTLYEEPHLQVTDLWGAPLGTVPLGDHADADGIPEADRAVVVDGVLHVALQRLDRGGGGLWPAAGPGRLIAVDPVSWTELGWFALGDNPRLVPGDPLRALTGVFGAPDGAEVAIDLVAGAVVETGLAEADAGLDFGVAAGGVVAAHSFAPDQQAFALLCDGGAARLDVDGWPIALIEADGAVYAAVRGVGGAVISEVWRVDPETCAIEVVAADLAFSPYGLAFVRGVGHSGP